jgi:hypothetical protein
MVTRSHFHAEEPKMLGASVQNVVARDLCNLAQNFQKGTPDSTA